MNCPHCGKEINVGALIGSVSTPAKARSSRENGKLGGYAADEPWPCPSCGYGRSLAAPPCSPAPVPSDEEHALAAKVLDALYAAKINLDTTKPSVVVTVIATQLRGRVRGNE